MTDDKDWSIIRTIVKKIKAITVLILATILFFSTIHLLIYWKGVFSELKSKISDNVIVLEKNQYDIKNNNHWVLLYGKITPLHSIEDKLFGVKTDGLFLERKVYVYQWRGGRWQWERDGYFSGYKTLPYHSKKFTSKYQIGEFKLSEKFSKHLKKSYNRKNLTLLPSVVNGFKNKGNKFYRGDDLENPKKGEIIVKYSSIAKENYTILGIQKGDTIQPYQDEDGNSFLFVEQGKFKALELLDKNLKRNHTDGIFTLYLVFIFIFTFIGFFSMRESTNILKVISNTLLYISVLFVLSWVSLLF